MATITAASLELSFARDVRFVRHLRQFVESLVKTGTADQTLAHQVEMTAAELGENAVKYAREGRPVVRVRVQIDPARGAITVESENEAAAEDIEEVHRIVRSTELEDPLEAYAAAMVESAERDVGSKLGFVRIRAEGGMNLKVFVEAAKLRIVAERALPRAAP